MRRRSPRTSRERTLAQWRGYWEPRDLEAHTEDSASAVEKAMRGLGLKDRFNEEQVFEAWVELVDPFIAQQARPVSLERGVLRIQVLHSTIHYELERMKGRILEAMQKRFGKTKVRSVRFQLG